MWSFLSIFIFAVEMATGLFVMSEIEYLAQPLQELSFTGIWSTVNKYAVRLIVRVREQILADVLDEAGVVRTFHQRNYLLLCFRVVGNIL